MSSLNLVLNVWSVYPVYFIVGFTFWFTDSWFIVFIYILLFSMGYMVLNCDECEKNYFYVSIFKQFYYESDFFSCICKGCPFLFLCSCIMRCVMDTGMILCGFIVLYLFSMAIWWIILNCFCFWWFKIGYWLTLLWWKSNATALCSDRWHDNHHSYKKPY